LSTFWGEFILIVDSVITGFSITMCFLAVSFLHLVKREKNTINSTKVGFIFINFKKQDSHFLKKSNKKATQCVALKIIL
jgi:hypothetical protein